MTQDTSWESNHRFIRWFAARAMRRAIAAGVRGVQLEDFVQEASIAWLMAVKHFDASKGVPFIPYLKLGMQRHINRWLNREIGGVQLAPFSLDKTLTEDSEDAFSEVVADTAETPDEFVIRQDIRARVLRRLSPTARVFLDLLENPPRELIEELRAISAKAEIGRSMGLLRFVPTRVSADLVYRFMGIPPFERTRINREIEDAIRKVTR